MEDNKALPVTVTDEVKEDKAATYVHKFKKPFEYEGKKYTTLNFYFDRLSGRDAIAAERELAASGMFTPTQEMSVTTLMYLAARAANIESSIIEALPLNDFSAVINQTRFFLMGVGLQ
jgi:hypothetical protein